RIKPLANWICCETTLRVAQPNYLSSIRIDILLRKAFFQATTLHVCPSESSCLQVIARGLSSRDRVPLLCVSLGHKTLSITMVVSTACPNSLCRILKHHLLRPFLARRLDIS